MRINRHVGLSALLALSLSGCTPHREPPPPTGIDEAVYRDALRTLASDDFLGRKPGTAGEEKTVAYLVERLRKIGLKPGNGESFLQQVPLLELTAAADASLSLAGPRGVRSLAYGRDMVIWSQRATASVQVQRSDLVFVGYGIVAPEYGWNDYADIDVHGKTVLVLANDPGFAANDPTVFKGGAMTQYGRWAYKIEQATRQGAAGVLLVHDADALGFGWSAVQSTWMGAQLRRPGSGGAESHAAVEGWIQSDAARDLCADAGRDFAAIATAAAHPGFKAISLGLKVDASIHNSLRQFNSANIVAILPGHKRHEYVLYDAHWDSLGVDATRAGHNIFNGAVDDATGVAGLVALAQSFVRTQPPPDRTIVFLAATAALPNQLGTGYYVENPIFPLSETTAVINLDSMLSGGPTRDVSIFGVGNSDIEDMARAEALLQGRETRPEPKPQRGIYYRSDSFNFARSGVPVLFVQSGIDNAARGPAWGQAQIDDYFVHRYRQTTDQYSPDWDVRGAIVDLTLYYDVGLRVARGRRFPRWYPKSEFRVARPIGQAPNEDGR
jgi:Zn-dependent M28 family amino/carboxypeptidase